MRFFFMVVLVVSTCTANHVKPYDALIKCDYRGKKFAVVLPTGPRGTMEIKKLEFKHPQQFEIQRTNFMKFKGYVCMYLSHLLFYQEIELFTVAGEKDLSNVDSFIWVAEVSQVSIVCGIRGEVLKTYNWNLGDLPHFSELSNVNVVQLQKILR